MFSFHFKNAKGFTIDLLDYLGSQAQYLHSLLAMQHKDMKANISLDRIKNIEMALEALRNVLRNNPGEKAFLSKLIIDPLLSLSLSLCEIVALWIVSMIAINYQLGFVTRERQVLRCHLLNWCDMLCFVWPAIIWCCLPKCQ